MHVTLLGLASAMLATGYGSEGGKYRQSKVLPSDFEGTPTPVPPA